MTNEEIRTLLQDAKTTEEAEAILQDNNIELSDEELEQIVGGAGAVNKKTIKEYKEYIIPSGD